VRATTRLTAFHRLAAANDWGNPLSTSASVSALLFARDEGFYYRATGVDLNGSFRPSAHGAILAWRAYGERQDSARVETQFSFAHVAGRGKFIPNVQACAGTYAGAAAALLEHWGTNPNGAQLSLTMRGERATGESDFGRASVELGLSRPIAGIAMSLVGSAGSSVGSVPPQRLFYLGGASTVRGQPATATSGDAFWFGRAELSGGRPLIHPVAFVDAGFAGSRNAWNAKPGRISGAGVGLAMLGGLVRVDVARGLEPARGWRADSYFELR
jgi:hypothetical protein